MPGDKAAPAAMPSEEDVATDLARAMLETGINIGASTWPDEQFRDALVLAREILPLFARILEEKEREIEQWQNLFEGTRASLQQDINRLERERASEKERADTATRQMVKQNDRILAAEAALAAIKAKHAEWRKCMPADWEGDPLSDTIE